MNWKSMLATVLIGAGAVLVSGCKGEYKEALSYSISEMNVAELVSPKTNSFDGIYEGKIPNNKFTLRFYVHRNDANSESSNEGTIIHTVFNPSTEETTFVRKGEWNLGVYGIVIRWFDSEGKLNEKPGEGDIGLYRNFGEKRDDRVQYRQYTKNLFFFGADGGGSSEGYTIEPGVYSNGSIPASLTFKKGWFWNTVVWKSYNETTKRQEVVDRGSWKMKPGELEIRWKKSEDGEPNGYQLMSNHEIRFTGGPFLHENYGK